MPTIERESDEGKKFGVTANLGSADKFLSYNPVKREFTLTANIADKTPRQFFTVTISI